MMLPKTSKLLYVAPFVEALPTSGASLRAMNLLKALAEDFRVLLLTYKPPTPAPLAAWCAEYHIELAWFSAAARYGLTAGFVSRLLSRQLPGFATHDPFSIVQDIDRLWSTSGPFTVIYFATQLMGQALRIRRWPSFHVTDFYDIYSLMAADKLRQVTPTHPYHWLFRIEAYRIRRYEQQILSRSDCILAVSEADRAFLAAQIGAVPVITIANGVYLPEQRSCGRTHEVITIGSHHHGPNHEGALWFYQCIWPQITKALPDSRWIVIGSGTERFASYIGDDNSVHIVGYASDLAPFYQNAICAAIPIQSGGGTRLKLLEAMAWAVPVVTTSKGAEGIDHGGSVHVADNPDQFAKAVIHCLQNPESVYPCALQARSIVAEKYSWRKIGETLRQTLAQHV